MAEFSLSFHSDDAFNLDHDNRKYSSKNIDTSKTKDNVSYDGNIDLKEFYMQTFQKSYEEFIQKQKASGHGGRVKDAPPTYYEFVLKKQTEGDAKVQDAKQKLAHQKEIRSKQAYTRVAKQIIVQMGNIDSLADLPPSEQKRISDAMTDALAEYMNTFQQENPSFKIVNAVIHRDEMSLSPHLHLTYVPIAEATRGQKIVNSESAALKEMGFVSDKEKRADGEFETCQTKWQTKERDRIIQIAKRYGIETGYTRGNRGKGQTLDEYRATKDAERNAKALSIKAEAEKSLSLYNSQTIAKQEETIQEQKKTYIETQGKLEDMEIRLQRGRNTLKELAEDLDEQTTKIANISKKIEKIDGFGDTVENAKSQINEIMFPPVPKEHPYIEKGLGKKKRKIYQVPEEDYSRLQSNNHLNNTQIKQRISNILTPIREMLEDMPFFKTLSETIIGLKKLIDDASAVIKNKNQEIANIKEENAVLQKALTKRGISPQELVKEELNRNMPARSVGDSVLEERDDR